MNTNKIVRSICYQTKSPSLGTKSKLQDIENSLINAGFMIQTKRICSPSLSMQNLDSIFNDPSLFLSTGTLTLEQAKNQLDYFCKAANIHFNLNLSTVDINLDSVSVLFEIIRRNPKKTFNFTYVFNNAAGSPYFPSASYKEDGFCLGLQPTDLSEGCSSIGEWLDKVKGVWNEMNDLFRDHSDFLGIDSSIAPLFEGKSSFVHFLTLLGFDFSETATTNTYLSITNFLKTENPKPIGLCGLMLPCLEDFELAKEYEKGNFTLERNIFLSLHSGLGVDTYPIGIDETPERVLLILKLLQGLSNKYHKPLSCRFVSDGKAKIGDRSDFQNQYLQDVVIRHL